MILVYEIKLKLPRGAYSPVQHTSVQHTSLHSECSVFWLHQITHSPLTVQSLSHVQLFLDLTNCRPPVSCILHYLPEFAQTLVH